MDLQMYQKHAIRTANHDLTEKEKLMEKAMGIHGELGELSEIVDFPLEDLDLGIQRDDVLDEGGDVLWYVVNACTLFDIDWTLYVERYQKRHCASPAHSIKEMNKFSAAFSDAVKKYAFHKHKALDMDIVLHSLVGLIDELCRLFAYYALTPEDVCEYNHLKLMSRYPNGFESARSMNREQVPQ